MENIELPGKKNPESQHNYEGVQKGHPTPVKKIGITPKCIGRSENSLSQAL